MGRGNLNFVKMMAAMAIKFFFSRTESPMILKLGMQHLGLKLYKVYINGDTG